MADWLDNVLSTIQSNPTLSGPLGVLLHGPAGIAASLAPAVMHPLDTAKRLAVGAYEGTVANDALPTDAAEYKAVPVPVIAPNGYRPAIVDTIGATGAAVKQLGHLIAPQYVDSPEAGGWLDRAAARSEVGSEVAHNQFGVAQAATPTEAGVEGAGGMLIGGGGLGTKAAQLAPQGLKTITKLITEFAVPLRNTSLTSAVPFGAAVQAGINAGAGQRQISPEAQAAAQINAPDSPHVSGLTLSSLITGGAPTKPSIVEQAAAGTGTDPVFAQMISQDQSAHENPILQPPPPAPDDVFGQMIAQDTKEQKERDDKAHMLFTAGMLGLTAMTGLGAWKFYKNKLPTGSLTGQGNPETILSGRQQLDTAVFDKTIPQQVYVDQFLGQQSAADYKNRVGLLSRVVTAARTRNFAITGEAPATGRQYTKITPLLNQYSALPLEKQLAIDDAMNASTALDTRNVSGTQPAFKGTSSADLGAKVAAVTTDPELAPLYYGFKQSYKDLSHYQVARGLVSQADHAQFSALNPNYSPLQKDVALPPIVNGKTPEFSANIDFRNRSMVQGGSVQEGEAASPVFSLLNNWNNTIHNAEMNGFRRDFLRSMDAASNGLVTRVINPNREEGLHVVFENGAPEYYKVKDPVLDEALHFYPRSVNALSNGMRKWTQNLNTGPLGTLVNGFAVAASTGYDAQMLQLLRQNGLKTGLVSMLTKGAVDLKGWDPTNLLATFYGSALNIANKVQRATADHLAQAATQGDSYLKAAIESGPISAMTGGKTTQDLADWIHAAYKAGGESQMDKLGITSHSLYGSPDSQFVEGLDKISMQFAKAQNSREIAKMRDAKAGFIKNWLAAPQNLYLAGKTNAVTHMYMGLLDAVANGTKRALYEANNSSIRNPNALASSIRNVLVDTSRQGSSSTVGNVAQAVAYSDVGIQTMYTIGKMASTKKGAVQLLQNHMQFALPALALSYYGLAHSKQMQDEYNNMSPTDRSRYLQLGPGVKLKLDPVNQWFMSYYKPLLDHISGAAQGAVSGDFIGGLEHFFENEHDQKDAFNESKAAFADSSANINPVDPMSNPVTAGLMSLFGAVPRSSRVLGGPGKINDQQVSGEDPDKLMLGNPMPATIENLLTNVTGAFGSAGINAANAWYRVSHQQGASHSGWDMATDSVRDGWAKGAGPFRGLLFPDYVPNASSQNSNSNYVFKTQTAAKQAVKVLQTEVQAPGMSNNSNTAVPLADDRSVRPEYLGSPAQIIGEQAQLMMQDIDKSGLNKDYNNLQDQIAALRTGHNADTPINQRKGGITPLVEKQQHIDVQRRVIMEQYEQQVRALIHDPEFTWGDYSPDKYKPH